MSEGDARKSGRDKRRDKRGWKTYRVRYGTGQPDNRALARRVSLHGLFISTNDKVFSPEVELVMELEVDGKVYRAVGVVRHSLRIDARFARVMKPGMGVEFLKMEKGLKEAIQSGG